MKQIATTNAPAAIGPYSQGLNAGNLTFISGQIPVDPATGKMAAEVLLGGKAPSDIAIATLTPSVSYNEDLCAQLGIEVPAN